MRASLSGRPAPRPRRRTLPSYSEPGERADPRPSVRHPPRAPSGRRPSRTTSPSPRPTPRSCGRAGASASSTCPPHPVADWAAPRRARLAEMFPGERLVVPAGNFKVRANDTDYRFRADTAHTYLTGNQTSDAVLVIEGGESRALRAAPVLARRPTSSSATGSTASCGPAAARRCTRSPTPSAWRCATSTSSPTALAGLGQDPGAARGRRRRRPCGRRRRGPRRATSRGCSRRCGWSRTTGSSSSSQEACDITTLGFADSVREWDNVLKYGERWIEGTFFRRARAMGNDIGYDSIVGGGQHATTLHWIENSGPITPGELRAARHGRRGPQPLHRRRHPHAAGRRHVHPAAARPLHAGARRPAGRHRRRPPGRGSWPRTRPRCTCSRTGWRTSGCCRCSAEEALSPDSKVYARWTLHSTSHMLGIDVHDCAAASRGDLQARRPRRRAWC